MKKAMIAMSGGVDSSVAAYLMQRNGYECVGVTLRLFDNADAGLCASRTCCSLADAEDARSAAYRLGMKHYVFNFTEDFRTQVIGRFAGAYSRGETPNPCIDCNHYLKFDRLLRRAAELGYDAVATGHYARISREGDRYRLCKAKDESKDQSYVLYTLTQEQLAHVAFPLGELHKADVRRLARELGLLNAEKRDSQDICFAPDGDYAAAVERYAQRSFPPGDFVDASGRVLGTHRGIIHYTVGQRRGLGISAPEPLYVCAVRPADNTVVLGPESALWSRELRAGEFRWISGEAPAGPVRLRGRIRYHQSEQWAAVVPLGGDEVRAVFDEPQRAVTRGQSLVLYDGDAVTGGGIIR